MALNMVQAMIQKLDGTILFWNSGAEALYGWLTYSAVGRTDRGIRRKRSFRGPLRKFRPSCSNRATGMANANRSAATDRAFGWRAMWSNP